MYLTQATKTKQNKKSLFKSFDLNVSVNKILITPRDSREEQRGWGGGGHLAYFIFLFTTTQSKEIHFLFLSRKTNTMKKGRQPNI